MLKLLVYAILLITQEVLSNPLLSIESPDGDIVDCINLREQPAFNHPLLQNHEAEGAIVDIAKMINTMEGKQVSQLWNQNGISCPDDTVPIRRNTVGTEHVKKMHWRTVPYAADDGHEYAIGETRYLGGIYGTAATMNVWNPAVEPGTGEFSLGQIWLVGGDYEGPDLNSIEAGWQVYPYHYLHNQPRLFIYWTNDTYEKNGCLNLECPGFVQVSKDYVLGGAISPVSTYGGNQYDVTMSIWKDQVDGNWWLGIGQSLVGYWPAKLFTHLADGPAHIVQWGGEVVNRRSYNQHTTTQMGSGNFAEEGFQKASFFRNLKKLDFLYHLQSVQEIAMHAQNPTCYSVKKEYNEEWGVHFYYGGPGYNSLCRP